MPDVPVCFIFDGAKSPSLLAKLPNATVTTRETVNSQVLRENSFGPGVTKMVAFFESPFESFLYLDADTTVCGDLSPTAAHLDFYDIVTDKRGEYDDAAIKKWFFDIHHVENLFPNFDWQSHRRDYFCTGAFFSRRNSLKLHDYIKALEISKLKPSVFKFWEMGILNFLIFQSADNGSCRVLGIPFQLVSVDHPTEMLQGLFSRALAGRLHGYESCVFHYPVTKPYLYQRKSFTYPMAYFRRQFQTTFLGRSRLTAEAFLNFEDLRFHYIPLAKAKFKLHLSKAYRFSGLRGVIRSVLRHSQ